MCKNVIFGGLICAKHKVCRVYCNNIMFTGFDCAEMQCLQGLAVQKCNVFRGCIQNVKVCRVYLCKS